MLYVDVKNLSKSYTQGQQQITVLKDLNLAIDKGESVAIIGQSGSGKSTFLSLLAGLDKPDLGTIIIAAQEITKLDEKKLAIFRGQTIGIVFQQFHLISHLSAVENVALPLEILGKKDATRQAMEALEQVGLGHRGEHKPHELSGGECQRTAIARAMVTKPSIILADEPSGNLDSETGDKVMNLLFQLTNEQKITLLLVTHNASLARKCRRTLQLKNGSLISVTN